MPPRHAPPRRVITHIMGFDYLLERPNFAFQTSQYNNRKKRSSSLLHVVASAASDIFHSSMLLSNDNNLHTDTLAMRP
jgi:hypothetical protein